MSVISSFLLTSVTDKNTDTGKGVVPLLNYSQKERKISLWGGGIGWEKGEGGGREINKTNKTAKSILPKPHELDQLIMSSSTVNCVVKWESVSYLWLFSLTFRDIFILYKVYDSGEFYYYISIPFVFLEDSNVPVPGLFS